MRVYRKDEKAKQREKAFRAGFGTLKADLINLFMRIGAGEMNGHTAADIVRNTTPDVARGTLPDVYT